jgi:hypothetical protein
MESKNRATAIEDVGSSVGEAIAWEQRFELGALSMS